MHHACMREWLSIPAVCIRIALACACLVSFASVGRSQCPLQWSILEASLPGVDGVVSAVASWDPDGPGPAGPITVIGGSFHQGSSSAVRGLAWFDEVANEWLPFGSPAGVGGSVKAIAALPNGDLIVAGSFAFLTAAGVVANNIARWDGTSWSALGSGTSSAVQAIAVLPNGDIVAGGGFQSAGGVAANRIARWDGTAWFPLGSGVSNYVGALGVFANGDIVAAGAFTVAGGVAANYIARWDGTSWSALGHGPNNNVQGVTVLPNGDLIAVGPFSWVGGTFPAGIPVNGVARWNGAAWSGLGSSSSNGIVTCVARAANGDLVVGGSFTNFSGIAANRVARWNGVAWSAMGSGFDDWVSVVAPLASGAIVAGGLFTSAGGVGASRVARWNGTWNPMGTGMSGSPAAVIGMPNGDIVVGGVFTYSGGPAFTNIARWDGSAWHALGSGITGFNSQVSALAVLANGDLVAGGHFSSAGGQSISHIARWDGTAWSALGNGVASPGYFSSLLALPNGDLIAGGSFTSIGGVVANRIARWNGTTWSPLGSGMDNSVDALALLPNGDIVAGGRFMIAGGINARCVARWNGTSWSALGSGLSSGSIEWVASVDELAVLPNGDVVAGGGFRLAGGQLAMNIARWDGSSWHAFGAGVTAVHALVIAPNGDPIVGANGVERWNGSSWTPLTGVDVLGNWIHALAWLPNGDLAAVGVRFLRRLATSCPASATPYGAGCAGGGGLNSLSAQSLPWLGSTFVVRATGLVPNSFVLGIRGFTATTTPLVNIAPYGVPGCLLLASPDVIELRLPGSSSATFAAAIPVQSSLVGAFLRSQAIAIEFDSSGGLTAMTGSNAILATIGAF